MRLLARWTQESKIHGLLLHSVSLISHLLPISIQGLLDAVELIAQLGAHALWNGHGYELKIDLWHSNDLVQQDSQSEMDLLESMWISIPVCNLLSISLWDVGVMSSIAASYALSTDAYVSHIYPASGKAQVCDWWCGLIGALRTCKRISYASLSVR